MSLVVHDEQVSFIYCNDFELKRGRRIELNQNKTIKAIIWHQTPVLDLCAARLIVSHVPVVYLQRKSSEADPIPRWCLFLYKLEQAQLFSGPMSDKFSVDCVVCWQRNNLGKDFLSCPEPIYTCRSCCAFWHAACAKSLGGRSYAMNAAAFTCAACV